MMKNLQKRIVKCLTLSMAASMLLTTGCGVQQKPAVPKTTAVPGQGARTLDTRNAAGTNQRDLRSAQSIANAVQKLPGIQSAYVLLGGGIAYVTVNLNATKNPSQALTANLKTRITNTVKQQDPRIKTVLITADPDAFHHFQKFATDVKNGRPVSGLFNQLFDVIHRVWPTQK
jgi:spore cortex protein